MSGVVVGQRWRCADASCHVGSFAFGETFDIVDGWTSDWRIRWVRYPRRLYVVSAEYLRAHFTLETP